MRRVVIDDQIPADERRGRPGSAACPKILEHLQGGYGDDVRPHATIR
jgi:hypothetical protein